MVRSSVRLHYRLRPGGQPVGDQFYGTIATTGSGTPFTLRNVAKDFDPRAEGGIVEIRFNPLEASRRHRRDGLRQQAGKLGGGE